VLLDSSACASVPAAELRHLLALELAPRRLAAPGEVAADDPRATHARIRCSSNQARLSVDGRAGRRQELELDLQETMASARTRLLALTLSELIATLEMETAQTAHPPLADGQAAAPTAANPVRVPEAWRGQWWLGAGLAREGRPALLAPALHSGLLWYVKQLPLAFQFDLLGSRGQRALAEGRLTAWTLAGSAALLARVRTAWLDVLLGAGARLGYARLDGATRTGSLAAGAVSGAWWGPLLHGSLMLRLHQRWGLRAALELAYVAKPVRGLDSNGGPAYALERVQLHALLALSVAFR
jgi:hypothetical protein